MNVDEAADLLETYVGKMNGVFTVGDLKYLSRTGRIKGSVAVVGNMLKIKPILRGSEDGYIVSYKNVRGRKAVLNELIRLFCETIEEPEKQIVGIAHADAYEESLYMMEEIQKRVKVREFINTSYDYCTGSHVGPDTIALFYLGKDAVFCKRSNQTNHCCSTVFFRNCCKQRKYCFFFHCIIPPVFHILPYSTIMEVHCGNRRNFSYESDGNCSKD